MSLSQVMHSNSSKFSGDMEGRQLEEAHFSDALTLIEADPNQDDLYYLAQAPIWSQTAPQESPLKELLEDICLPAFLKPQTSTCLQSVNLWMAPRWITSIQHHFSLFTELRSFCQVISYERQTQGLQHLISRFVAFADWVC